MINKNLIKIISTKLIMFIKLNDFNKFANLMEKENPVEHQGKSANNMREFKVLQDWDVNRGSVKAEDGKFYQELF